MMAGGHDPVTIPNHAEGAPGPSLLGTGDIDTMQAMPSVRGSDTPMTPPLVFSAKRLPAHRFLPGKERDTESGNEYFGARYYASSMGRFMSPDWSAKQEPVPYAKLDDPQSLNLYAYVRNNPLVRADLDGHADCGGQGQQPCPPPPPPAPNPPNPNPPQPTPNPNPPAPTPTPKPAPPVTPLAGVLRPAADAAAQAAKQAAKGIPKPTPNPIPRPVPEPDPVPPQLLPGEPGPLPEGAGFGRTVGWIVLQFFKGIGNAGSNFIICATCQQQMQEMQRQHDMYCGKNNPDCSAELSPEEWPNSAEVLRVPRRS
jgi:RHS repeat-associated protein